MTPLFRKFLGINWLLALTMFGMVVFGVFSIHSATYFRGGELANKWNDQMINAIIGTVVFFVVALIDYRWIKWAAIPAYVGGIGLLLLVKVMGEERSGAQSWLKLPGMPAFQPSQVAIMGGILLLALILGYLPKKHRIFQLAPVRILLACIVAAIPAALVLKEPDIGSAAVWGPALSVMLLIGAIPLRYLIVGALMGLFMLPLIYFFGLKVYQKERIETYIGMLTGGKVDEQGAGWVPKHNMIAIGSAGWKGKGYKGSRMGENDRTIKEMGFVPANVAMNDFIFVVIAEEHGFRGSIVLIAVVAFMLIQCLIVAFNSRDQEGRLIVAGFCAQIFFHTFMNIGMCILLVPITGLPLPFVSYGGTFLIIMMFMMGLTQSVWIHRHTVVEEAEKPKAEFRG